MTRCDQDHWPEQVQRCYLAAKTEGDLTPCGGQLTAEQGDKLVADLKAIAPKEPAPIDLIADASVAALPWIERAEKVLPALLDGKNGALVANAVQTIAHSQGNKPSLKTYEIRRMAERISLRLVVNWEGAGLLRDSSGNPVVYTTEVVWEFSERGHGSARITADDGSWHPSTRDAQNLDNWFRDTFYPSLYKAADG